MRGKFVFLLLLMAVDMCFGKGFRKDDHIKLPPIVCYASEDSKKHYVPLSDEFRLKLKSASAKTADIKVSYVNFPEAAKTAFQYAVDIWQTLIASDIPIHVTATWKSLSASTLGSCGPSDYYKNFNSTEKVNCYYPVALAEKMLGEEINGADNPDIEASFNKDFNNWYFGTDGNTPADKYDFVTVVLHELTHGLGFTGNFYVDRGRGGYGGDGFPAIFDRAVENKKGDRLVNNTLFPNPSVALYQNLTSGWLAYDTEPGIGSLPRIYAPATWDNGSSIYHLDENTYPNGDNNSLMTPFSSKGEAIHDPGNSSLSIMYHMGWKTVSIKHTPLKDIELVTKPILFEATVKGDYEIDQSKVFLVYSSSKFVKKDSVLMKPTGTPSVYSAQLNISKNGDLNYFIAASDIKNRRFVYPGGAPSRYITFTIGPDKEVPVITHEPVKYMLDTDLNVNIIAQATDNISVKALKIEYFVPKGTVKELNMKNDSVDYYSGMLSFPAGSLKDNDIINYRIVATDASSQSNQARWPETGFTKFRVAGFREAVANYSNNFSVDTLDFISSDFRIYTVSGFDSNALNTKHPYQSPNIDNAEFNFISILKYPIILNSGSKMSFDEIVLVEPGDAGSKFGDENFWDYVVVEGSADEGITWKPLQDGYDSGLQKTWYNLFSSSMNGQNSTAVPTKDLFINHEINMLASGNFKAGDTIQVRFRLFSDPYANGWGWIIDNLKIQDMGTSNSSELLSPGEVSLYPNPAEDVLNVDVQTSKIIKSLYVKAYNASGQQVYNHHFEVGSAGFQAKIDLSSFEPGLYLFSLEPQNGQAISRKIVIR